MKSMAIGLLLALFASALLADFQTAVASDWAAMVDEQHGLPLVRDGTTDAVRSSYAFWGANWRWASQSMTMKVVGPYDYALAGKNTGLDFDIGGRASRSGPQQLTWELDIDARKEWPDVIGGGIVFKFDLDVGKKLGTPQLLSDNRGWLWGRKAKGQPWIELTFEPPGRSAHFERGRPDELRVFLFRDRIAQGHLRQKMTLTVSGDMIVGPSDPERFGAADVAAWHADILDWRSSPVDLSFLNQDEKPAGRRGFVRAAGEKLLFEDGTEARFWGTNLTAAALFGTSPEAVRQQARRLSQLGFNLVRLHHHDSHWVDPNIFGTGRTPTTAGPDPAQQEKLDWWIKCLKEEGIYVWLDLHVQRHVKAGDGIEHFEEIAKGKPTADLKGYSYVNRSLREAMKRFNERYVGHVNRHTGMAYKDEPAIVAMLITNENDVTHHFGNALLPDKKVPRHSEMFMRRAEAFAAKHGLPKDKVWRTWEHGPAKLFLNDLEREFNVEMLGHLRALGVKVPIATTSSWGYNPVSSLPALSVGGVVDVHSYGGKEDIGKNPLHQPNLVSWMAAAQVAGMPLTVTEWNAERFPVVDRHVLPLYVAASAGMQGWDALMQYAYSQIPLDSAGHPSNWHAFNDPGLIAAMPAAALLYRQQHVREASSVYVFAPSAERFYGEAISPATSVALRTAAERGKLVVALPETRQLPWLRHGKVPDGARAIRDPAEPLVDRNASAMVSDNGEVQRDWGRGIFSVDTPRTQAAMGWIGGNEIRLADVRIDVATRNAVVAVQSLDGKPVRQSCDILVSMGARVLPRTGRSLPFHAEPVEGRIYITAPPGLKLYRGGPARGSGQSVPYLDGRYVITLTSSLATYWLALRP